MHRRPRWIIIPLIAVAAFVTVAAASANGVPGGPTGPVPHGTEIVHPPVTLVPPPDGPGPAGRPTIWVSLHSSNGRYGPYDYPYDFSFDDQVSGAGFKPGEHVSISVTNVSAPVVTAIADDAGAFNAQIAFTWRFCGPGASTSPAPVFTASGSDGSTASFAVHAPPCPDLLPLVRIPKPQTGGSGASAGSGTAVSGTAVAVPGTATSSGTQPPNDQPPQPVPTRAPMLLTFDVPGFGFMPGEAVTVREIDAGSYLEAQPVQATADALGRIKVSVQAYVPPPCGPWPRTVPELVATGNKGTVVVARLLWYQPMVMCPVMGAPAPTVPSHTASNASPNVLTIRLHPMVVHPGGWERVRIVTDAAGRVHIVIRYPGHRILQIHRRLGAGGHVVVRWRVGRGVRRGWTHVHLIFIPNHIAVTTGFRIR